MSVRQRTLIALLRSDGQIRRLYQAEQGFSESASYVYPQFLADHALDFLQDGFRARDPLALEGLVLLHAPSNSLSPQGVGPTLPNPRLFLRYAWLMQRLFGEDVLGERAKRTVAYAAASLDPDQLQSIRNGVEHDLTLWSGDSRIRPRENNGMLERPAVPTDVEDCSE
jgi:hypothetical protein